MDSPNDDTAAGLSTPIDPIKVTRQRLVEIGQVWIDYAKQRTESIASKLPKPFNSYLKQRPRTVSESGQEAA